MKILVTGASGFVGDFVVGDLASKGHEIVALAGRNPGRRSLPNVTFHAIDLTAEPALEPLLEGVTAVLHLAGRAHSRDAGSADAYAIYRPLNCDAVASLAQASANAGVKRFVLLSTIHVNGRRTTSEPFRETTPPVPSGAYGQSKYDGEQRLVEISARTGMEWCVVRPPLVVGPKGKANLANLVKLVSTGLPLPFAALRNRRSVVGLRNLSEFLELCLAHPCAANALFLIADRPPLSTGDLAAQLAQAAGKPRRQFAVPNFGWRLAAAIPLLERKFGALWESLEIDTSKAEQKLAWQQPYPTDTAFADLMGAGRDAGNGDPTIEPPLSA